MSYYTTPIDIANRGLQHCGAQIIAHFTDNSRNAVQAGLLYDKARRAELRRSVWKFAAKRAVLRPITSAGSQQFSPLAYAGGGTYAAGVVVSYLGVNWISMQASNMGNTPGLDTTTQFWAPYFGPMAASVWSPTTAYYPGDLVSLSGQMFLATAANTNAVTSGAPWLAQGAATATTLTFFSPIGYGATSADGVRSIYRLPANYLRIAPQDVKTADTKTQNVTAGMGFNDWQIDGQYLLSAGASPIFFRFVSDMVDVTQFDDMFCEMLGARMGMGLMEPLTQSREKLGSVSAIYNSYSREARAVNAIESGSTEDGAGTGNEKFDDATLAAEPAAPAKG